MLWPLLKVGDIFWRDVFFLASFDRLLFEIFLGGPHELNIFDPYAKKC